MSQGQFTLRTLLLIVTGCCGAAAAVRGIGLVPLVTVIVLALGVCVLSFPFVFVWCVAHHFAPTPTRNGTVLLLAAFCISTLLVCWTYQAQEKSRRNQCGERLIQLGQSFGSQQRLHPEETNWNARAETPWLQYYGFDFATGTELPSGSRN